MDLTFQDFKLLEMKFDISCESSHQILMKPHSVRDPDPEKPSDLTLFLINLPPFVTEENLTQMMKQFGKIKRVFLHNEPNSKAPLENPYPILNPREIPTGFKVGYVVFTSKQGVQKIMGLPSETILILSSEKNPVVTGLKKWYKEYNDRFIPLTLLKEESERIIKDYDDRIKREKEAASNEPDDEGWISVHSKKKRQKLEERGKKNTNRKRRQKKQILLNFYSFQKKELKLEHLAEHRKKYEEDKKRLELMKNARKFRPL